MYYCFNYFPTDLNKGHSFIQKRKKKKLQNCISYFILFPLLVKTNAKLYVSFTNRNKNMSAKGKKNSIHGD